MMRVQNYRSLPTDYVPDEAAEHRGRDEAIRQVREELHRAVADATERNDTVLRERGSAMLSRFADNDEGPDFIVANALHVETYRALQALQHAADIAAWSRADSRMAPNSTTALAPAPSTGFRDEIVAQYVRLLLGAGVGKDVMWVVEP